MKKGLTFWLAVICAIGCLTGCHSSESTAANTDKPGNKATSTTVSSSTTQDENVTDGSSSGDTSSTGTATETSGGTSSKTTSSGKSSSSSSSGTTKTNPTTGDTNTSSSNQTPTANTGSTTLTPVAETSYYGRSLLANESNSLLTAYDRLVTAAKSMKTSVNVSDLSLSTHDAERVMQYYMDDYPQHFHLSTSEMSYTYSGSKAVSIDLIYTMTGTEWTNANAEMERVVNDMLDGLHDGMSAYDRERILYTRLIQRTTYQDGSEPWRYTMYGALVKRQAVCDGYSHALQYLLKRAGIPTIRAFGVSQSQDHAWNMVQLDGNWYHVDATWDDPLIAGVTDFVGYTYLNVTTAQIQRDHSITGLTNSAGRVISYPIPTATAADRYYFTQSGATLATYDHNRVLSICKTAIDNGLTWVGFRVTGSVDAFANAFNNDYYTLKSDLANAGYTQHFLQGTTHYNDDQGQGLIYIDIK